MRHAIIITIIMVFLPVHLSFMGKDALTTGTISIMILYVLYLKERIKCGKIIVDNIDKATYLLIIIASLSTFLAIKSGVIEGDLYGHAVRQLLCFSTALLLFIVIKNCGYMRTDEYTFGVAEMVVSVILSLIAVHVVIAVMMLGYPPIEDYLKIFYGRDAESAINEYEEINRSRSFVFSPEQYGEMLAALSPFLVYKVVKEKRIIWHFIFILFALGLMLSVTRSGILLFLIGAFTTFYCLSKKNRGIAILTIITSTVFVIITITINPQLFSNITQRFTLASEAYSSHSGVLEIINRDNLPEYWNDVMSNISLVGHSLARVDYHNLFLTTLQQIGIIGSAFFFLIILFPLVSLIWDMPKSNNAHQYFKFSCLMFMILFLVNELKFEFTRTASYQQICWALFGVVYLVIKCKPNTNQGLCRQMGER